VGDRSFLTELLALVLAATFVCPCSAYGSVGKPSPSVSGCSQNRWVVEGSVNVLPHATQSAPDRHASKLRGVLDDDGAILGDDSEDWLEWPAGLSPQYPASSAPGLLPVTGQIVGMLAGPSHTYAWPIHFLCSYQC
jgi:hypothetical protein